jgi:16S rRNA (guanine(966)-N(2))-methyltransferase RsmD
MKPVPRKPAKSPVPRHAPQQVRIIGGTWKRSLLAVVDAEGLRPTPDRVRETVFNWINHLIDGRWEQQACLDLFAGTGALGFEAASRGACKVVMVENHSPAVRQLEAAKQKLQASQVVLHRGDALAQAASLASRGERFDLIFLDPPFHQDWLARLLPACAGLLQPLGLLYVESEASLAAEDGESLADGLEGEGAYAGWSLLRAGKAGSVYFHILQRKKSSGEMPENQA